MLCRSEGNLKSPGHCGRAGSSPAPDTALVLKYSYMLFEARRIDSDFALFLIGNGAPLAVRQENPFLLVFKEREER